MMPRIHQGFVSLSLGVLMLLSPALPAVAQTQPPEIRTFTLPSGQKLYVREDHSQPIVTIDTWVNVGSVNETDEINGVSHFLEHLLFKGTQEHVAGEFERILETKGGEFNAATSDDFTHYYITIASPFFAQALDLHADMLTNAAIPADELNRERLVVQEEINRANDNPDRLMYTALAEMMYGKHGYAYDTLGPKENIANIPRERILEYYHYWYQPKNFHTVVVGDVNAEQARDLVGKEFAATPFPTLPKTYQPPTVGTPAALPNPQVKVMTDPDITQAYFTIGFPGPSVKKPEDVYAMDIAMLTLGSGKSSRLYRRLVEQEPLAISVGAGNFTQKYSGLLYAEATTSPAKLKTVKEELVRQVRKLKAGGITAEELEKSKTRYLKDFIYQNETTAGVAQSLGYNVTIGTLEDYQKHLERIRAVSPEAVREALSKYLDFNQAVIVEMLPPNSQAAGLTPETERQSSIALLQSGEFPTITAEKPANTGADMPSKKADPTITEEVLGNGLTLITKRQPESETVAFKVFVKGGQAVEPMPGVASLVASMMMKGTRTRTAEQISEELESRGLGLSVAATEDYMEITGSALREDVGELFLILRDVLKNPVFAESELAKQKVLVAQALQASRDNPSSVAFEKLTLALYPDHPYGNVGKRVEENLDNITRTDLIKYYRTFFRPENMTAVAVGNFPIQVIKSYATETFSDLQKQENPVMAAKIPAVALTSRNIPESQVVKTPQENLSAVWMAQGWLMPPINSADYLPLKVLNTMLGEGMSSRLFVNLREKQGLAYTVGSFYPSRRDTSRFVLYIGTDPANQEKVREGFLRELESLKTTLLSEDELQDAKDKLTGNFALAHETNASQAQYLGMYEMLGVGYEYDKQYPKLIQQVTPEDIQRVAKKYFSQPSVLSLVVPGAPAKAN